MDEPCIDDRHGRGLQCLFLPRTEGSSKHIPTQIMNGLVSYFVNDGMEGPLAPFGCSLVFLSLALLSAQPRYLLPILINCDVKVQLVHNLPDVICAHLLLKISGVGGVDFPRSVE